MLFQNQNFNSKMEKQFGEQGIVPQLVLKQEELFDSTMVNIQNFASIIAQTIYDFGKNLLNSSGGYFNNSLQRFVGLTKMYCNK